jgi:hypothetical protein
MAQINIPDDVLSDEDVRTLQNAVNDAVIEKRKTGKMTLDRFIQIIKSVCSWIWDKIKGFIQNIWRTLGDVFN